MNAEIGRDEIVRRFEELLDKALGSEEAPQEIDPEILRTVTAEGDGGGGELDRRCDSFALWAAMTALTQEVKLQGRGFRELSEALGSAVGRIAEEVRAAYRERQRDLEEQAERRCRKQALSILIDLRDRMGRGLESARKANAQTKQRTRGASLARWFGNRGDARTREAVEALIKGYELGLEHLDQAIEDWNAHEIRCQGMMFDPRRMNAIDKEESATVAEGTVLEVYRSGYEWNGEIFRPAQVKVACAPAPIASGQGEKND